MKRVLRFRVVASGIFLLCVATAIAWPAQTFTSLFSFNGTDGAFPYDMSLVQGTDGNYYGTTGSGGTSFDGTVFKMTPAGTLTTLHSFAYTDGQGPRAGLIQASNGEFYGTTFFGGAYGYGSVFKIASAGALTTLYSFCAQIIHENCPDGSYPWGGLVQATNGNFYGTTCGGLCNALSSGEGTVFEMTTGGTLTTLYSFCVQSNCSDGRAPTGALIQASNGNLYGTAGGGAYGSGEVFEMTTGGTLTTLYSFCAQSGCPDGFSPSGLVQASNRNFYGTTAYGGVNNGGTLFQLTTTGTLTTLYSFCAQAFCTDGSGPIGPLVQATNGDLYGATSAGGNNCQILAGNCGTLFEITPAGTFLTLYSFCTQNGCPDGQEPFGGLVQGTNGILFGTTSAGGTAGGDGTVFSLSVGLGPFVETRPASGKVGAKVIILGDNLTGATSVTLNGTAATFRVVSATEITTTVPTGATSGPVKVTTAKKTLKSNVAFRVK